MKQLIVLIFALCLLSSQPGIAQNIQKSGEVLQFELSGYKAGQIQWQFSNNQRDWINITGANSMQLIQKASQSGFFRAEVDNGNCPFFSEETFIYVPSTDSTFPRIIDEGANLKIQWDFNISPLLVDHYLIGIQGKDTTIRVDGAKNELLLARRMDDYQKTFSIRAFTRQGLELPEQFIQYENDYYRFFTCKQKFIAHRGLSSLYPENTAIAYEKAAKAGFEFVECDIWVTKDHQWVLCHDETIDRTSNGTGKISDYTLEELQRFNFGYQKNFGNRYPQQILSLKEFLELCKNLNIKPVIEIKQGTEADIKTILEITNPLLGYDRYAIHSFSPSALYAVRKFDKKANLGLVTNAFVPGNLQDLDNLFPCFYNVGYTMVSMDQPFNNQSNSALYHLNLKGIVLSIWTIDNPKYFDNLLNNNLFIITGILPRIFKEGK